VSIFIGKITGPEMSVMNDDIPHDKLYMLIAMLLDGAVTDAEKAMNDMISSYVEMTAEFEKFKSENPSSDLLKFEHHLGKLLENMQFFDALSQRVNHVASAMDAASESQSCEESVKKIYTQVSNSYTTLGEHRVHEKFIKKNSESPVDQSSHLGK
jgi:hypothetical protein